MQGWRSRLVEAVEKSGKSRRAISLESGNSHGYVHSILEDGKEPGISKLFSIADAAGVSVSWLMYGIEMSHDTETLLRIYSGLDADQKRGFLQLAEAAAGLAGQTKP